MKYYIFLLIGAIDGSLSIGQDFLPLAKKAIIFKVRVTEQNHKVFKGYLGRINDSILYISASPIPINLNRIDSSILKPFNYKYISSARLQGGNTGRGLLIGTGKGALISIVGLLAASTSFPIGNESVGLTEGEKSSLLTETDSEGSIFMGIRDRTTKKRFLIKGKKVKFSKLREWIMGKLPN